MCLLDLVIYGATANATHAHGCDIPGTPERRAAETRRARRRSWRAVLASGPCPGVGAQSAAASCGFMVDTTIVEHTQRPQADIGLDWRGPTDQTRRRCHKHHLQASRRPTPLMPRSSSASYVEMASRQRPGDHGLTTNQASRRNTELLRNSGHGEGRISRATLTFLWVWTALASFAKSPARALLLVSQAALGGAR